MKKSFSLLMISLFIIPVMVYSQDGRALRASRNSFSSAQDNYNKGNYQQAIREYKIVVNTVPANIDSRRDLTNRLESLIDLIDIYFYKHVNISKACEYVHIYNRDMNTIRGSGVLRAYRLLEFQKKEQEYVDKYMPKCKTYEHIDDDMDKFRRKFDEEMKDN